MEHNHKPSIFELLACDNLKGGLRDGLRYLLTNIYQIEQIKQLKIPQVDESVLLIDLLIEYNYLKSYNASYAENLYNLIRLDRRNDKKSSSLLPSLVCLTIVPYVKRKLDKYIEDINYKPVRTADDLRKIRLYKLYSNSSSLLNLVCIVRLASGKSDYYNILDRIFNIKLMGRSNNDDNLSLTLFDSLSKTIADLMGHGLTIGSYIIQFLDYWNTHNNSAPLFNASLPIPEPPEKRENNTVDYSDDKSSNICLICLHVRQNECALSNTGYVFCYSCLHRYIITKQRCPITGHPAKLDNIVKLYTNNTTSISSSTT